MDLLKESDLLSWTQGFARIYTDKMVARLDMYDGLFFETN